MVDVVINNFRIMPNIELRRNEEFSIPQVETLQKDEREVMGLYAPHYMTESMSTSPEYIRVVMPSLTRIRPCGLCPHPMMTRTLTRPGRPHALTRSPRARARDGSDGRRRRDGVTAARARACAWAGRSWGAGWRRRTWRGGVV